nr:putative ribonuclease H-like domain-containing protein [Tanacetum cinerariifolium]
MRYAVSFKGLTIDGTIHTAKTFDLVWIWLGGEDQAIQSHSLGNAMSFENRLEDFFRDTSDVVSLNEVEADLSNMETTIQEEGIDYKEVFAPVTRIEAIRIFIAYASYMGFTVYQIDVKSAFLYETIDEEVYVMQPPSFQDLEFPHRVYKVEKAMYGLHQAPKAWYGTLSKYLLDNGFQRGTIDQTLFIRKHKGDFLLIQVSMIGSLMYLTASRLDIMFAVCACARHQVTPKECHLHVVKRIFRIVQFFVSMLVPQGEGSKHPSEPNHTPLDQDESIHHEQITQSLQYAQITSHEPISQSHEQTTSQEPTIPSQSHFVITTPRRITKGTIRISQSKFPSPGADETAFPTGDVRYGEAFPTVTSLDAWRMLQTRWVDQREDLLVEDTMKDSDKSADNGSDSTDEMANILGTSGAVNMLASGGLRSVFTTASLLVSTASTGVSPAVATASESFPTAAIFTTATRRTKEKREMTEPKQPSKEKVLEQISVQLARDLEAKFDQEDQIIREQAERDSEIARIHAEREPERIIVELDRSNELVVKYLSKYEQAEAGLSHDEKVELIDELLNNAGWKAKDFKGTTFEQIKEKFIPVWEKMQDFVLMNSKLESERLKRLGIQLDKERFKKLKTAEASSTEPTQE